MFAGRRRLGSQRPVARGEGRAPGWLPLHDGLLRPPLVATQGRGGTMRVDRPAKGTGRPEGLPHGPPHNAERAMFSPYLTPPIVKLCCTPLPHSAERDSFYLTQCHEAPVVGPGVASSPLPTMAAPGLPERWPICQPDDTSKGCEEQHVEPGPTSPTRCSGPV